MAECLKVGELARRSGLTVRTLHHWDEIGLLRPSRHTAAGHRLYEKKDVARLHRICSLRFLGFGLAEIARLLERPERHLAGLIRGRLADLEAQIELAQSLKSKLETFAQRLEAEQLLTLDEMMNQLELMKMYEKYYTPDQLTRLEERRRALGPEAIAAAEEEWPRLIADVQALRSAGVAPGDPKAQALAARWMALVEAFTGGDPGIAAAASKLYQEPGAQQKQGLDPEIFAYIREARAAAGRPS